MEHKLLNLPKHRVYPPPPLPPVLSSGRVLISYGCTIKLKLAASTNHPIFWTRIWENGVQNDPIYRNNDNIYNEDEDVRVSPLEQEFLTIRQHLSSSRLSRFHVVQSLCWVFVDHCLFVSFLLETVLSVFHLRLWLWVSSNCSFQLHNTYKTTFANWNKQRLKPFLQ